MKLEYYQCTHCRSKFDPRYKFFPVTGFLICPLCRSLAYAKELGKPIPIE